MQDRHGNELKVGDEVVFLITGESLARGTIIEIWLRGRYEGADIQLEGTTSDWDVWTRFGSEITLLPKEAPNV